MSRAERLLSYSLLALITSRPLATATTTIEEEDEIPSLTDKGKGAMNSDGAWCWREGCTGEFEQQPDRVFQQLTETTTRLPQVDEIHAKGGGYSPERSGHVR